MAKSQLTVNAIDAFNDNYIWVIGNSNNKNVALVDPGDAAVCLNYLKEHNLILTDILITHHHKDHTGGIKILIEHAPQHEKINIYGPKNENIDGITQQLAEQDNIQLTSLDCFFEVIDVPGHTAGHIAYYHPDMLFCGDTLFSGGCGRLFEGTARQMHNSLTKLANLPAETPVYCTHEYTLANLTFALTIEPNNQALQQYYHQVKQLRENNARSIPTSIAQELVINPFLRCQQPDVIACAARINSAANTDPIETFAVIRQLKDQF